MQKIIAVLKPTLLAVILLVGSISLLGVGKSITTDLAISGTTATCSVSVRPESIYDNIEVSVQLVCGSEVVADWSGLSGIGSFRFNEDVAVKKGKTYTMKTTCSINGTSYPIVDVTKKCK